jgi:hypothetical protein
MNRLIYFKTIILAFLLSLFSCDKETAVTLPTIGEVTYEVGYGEISFNWNFPQEQDVEYVRVDFSERPKIYTANVKNHSFTIFNSTFLKSHGCPSLCNEIVPLFNIFPPFNASNFSKLGSLSSS